MFVKMVAKLIFKRAVILGIFTGTLQPLYKTVCYNTVLDIIHFKDGSQKCIDYIEK